MSPTEPGPITAPEPVARPRLPWVDATRGAAVAAVVTCLGLEKVLRCRLERPALVEVAR